MSMNEFNTPAAPDEASEDNTPTVSAKEKPKWRHLLFEKQYIWGLNGIWLSGIALGFIILIWSQIATMTPDTPNVTALAGLQEDSIPDEHDTFTETTSVLSPAAPVNPDITGDEQELKAFANANREAISRLADNVKSLNTASSVSTQRLLSIEASIAALEDKMSSLESRLDHLQVPGKAASKGATAAMHVSSVQQGAAWIAWQGKTWSVKEGDRLGKVTITRIDAQGRQVFTSDGVIR